MTQDIQLRVEPKAAASDLVLQTIASTNLDIDVNRIKGVRIVKRSIDARQRKIMINVTLRVYVDEPVPEHALYTPIEFPDVTGKPSAVIVGAGPAGLFAALRLIELGVRPLVLERGKDVDSRRLDMSAIAREDVVNPDSNYCFGEGGAGAFSDGKLYTRSKKRGNVDEILRIFCQHGASEDILVDAHPHIGTDRLPDVIKAMRGTIEGCGGEIRFSTRVEDLKMKDGEVVGVIDSEGNEYDGPVILATGHSARDTYRMLLGKKLAMQPKGIAIGVRLEHPQELIDKIMYHNPNGRGKFLPPAEYSLLTRVDDRAVYSFCMCPGGVVIPSASGAGQQAVNGMSPSNRGSKWANSGMVVEILVDDIPGDDPLKIMAMQERIEASFFHQSDNTQNAPAQRMTDFVAGKESKSLAPTSYAPGVHCARVDNMLPYNISSRLKKAFEEFGKKYKGFLTEEATVVGCETRTSAPVQLLRDKENLESLSHPGIFPAGEGAGFAGGIVSAAIDGRRAAEALFNIKFASA